MKKTFVLILAISACSFAQAQQAQTAPASTQQQTKPSPEMMATRHSNHLQKTLGLTEDQKQKVYTAILTRNNAVQTIRAKYGQNGDKKAMHSELKPAKEQFIQTMDGILTPDQKTKWDEYRLKMKENRGKNYNSSGNLPPANGNGAPQKLTNEDDGIDN